jgi:hypothetical protein
MLAVLGAHHILHVSRIRVKKFKLKKVKDPHSGPLNCAIVAPCVWWMQRFGADFCQHCQPRLALSQPKRHIYSQLWKFQNLTYMLYS